MHRCELSDQQWARIEPFLPHRTHHGKLGHPFNDHRPVINGMLWIRFTLGLPGVTSPIATGLGKPSTTASTAGEPTAPGFALPPPCWTNWTNTDD